jgi:protein SCO1
MKARTALVALLVGAILLAGCARPARLDTLWDAPRFALTDEAGQPFSSDALSGKVWLIDFIYTSCPDVCPIYLSAKMKQLQDQILASNLVGQAELVSLTVDPRRDTPAELATYGARFGANPRVWNFLTGPEPVIQDLTQNGFKVGSAVKAEMDTVPARPAPGANTVPASDSRQVIGSYSLVHSSYFLLVDRHGKIRATYDGTEVEADKIFADIQQLLRER